MTRPTIILDAHWRELGELFAEDVLQDLRAIFAGKPPQNLGRADPARIKSLAGVGDAASVSDMAGKR